MPVLYLIRDKDTQAGKEAEADLREISRDLAGNNALYRSCRYVIGSSYQVVYSPRCVIHLVDIT